MTAASVVEILQEVVEAGFSSDHGRLAAIFIRPATDEREELQEAVLTAAEGVRGDRWKGEDPRSQITLMNAAVLDCLARGDRSRWAQAGDQLIVDLDLSEQNLPPGQRLLVGGTLVEVTDEPHTGCGKFAWRFGPEALAFINGTERRHLRLRGCYVKVIADGTVRVGDEIVKVER
ncbi:MAG TPA: MOSC domain-containing protein [Planctomycetaceae bacterium]|nr:MOSC domain-containing protein [Planctomycetaceae bacterium]